MQTNCSLSPFSVCKFCFVLFWFSLWDQLFIPHALIGPVTLTRCSVTPKKKKDSKCSCCCCCSCCSFFFIVAVSFAPNPKYKIQFSFTHNILFSNSLVCLHRSHWTRSITSLSCTLRFGYFAFSISLVFCILYFLYFHYFLIRTFHVSVFCVWKRVSYSSSFIRNIRKWNTRDAHVRWRRLRVKNWNWNSKRETNSSNGNDGSSSAADAAEDSECCLPVSLCTHMHAHQYMRALSHTHANSQAIRLACLNMFVGNIRRAAAAAFISQRRNERRLRAALSRSAPLSRSLSHSLS